MRLIALVTLKQGVTRELYEARARKIDLPTVTALPSVRSFRVFRTLGQLGSSAPPPYSHIEIIEVDDMGQFGRDVASSAIQDIVAGFADMASVVFMTAEEILA